MLGVSLDEAMNVKLTNLVTEDKSYAFEVEVIDYLIACTNYDFTTYSKTGIDGLITKLKEKYPNFDVSYLLNLLDSNTRAEQAGIKALDAQENIIEALFNFALENIDENNLYSAFKNFSSILSQDNYYVYLDKYLDKLNELGYSNDKTVIIDWLKIYQDVKMFIKIQGVVYPVKYKHFNESLGKDVYVVIDNNKSSQYIDNGSIIESNSSQFCFQDIMEEAINNLSVEDFSWANFASKYGYFKENKEMTLNNGR